MRPCVFNARLAFDAFSFLQHLRSEGLLFQKTSLVLLGSIGLFFNSLSYLFSVANQPLPLDVSTGDHGKIASDDFAYASIRIPELAKRVGKIIVQVIEKVMNPFHPGFDFPQTSLLVALASQREA